VGWDSFGGSTSLSGNTALVGASGNDSSKGAAYIFRNLDTAGGAVAEAVKLTASDSASGQTFGASVSLDGDRFLIGANAHGPRGGTPGIGKAYSGRISAFTTLDGGVTRSTDGISFVSRENWIAGQNTDNNLLVLSAGDSSTVSAAGKKVMVGQNAGSDNNILAIDGFLTANTILVGAAGNTGNSLQVGKSGVVTTSGGVIISMDSNVGGDGTINGDLRFSASSSFIFAGDQTLTVNGSVLFDGSFGVTNLIGLDSFTPNGMYTLIDGTTTNFATSGLSNWGTANAYNLGGGKSAWFEQGSLRLVVVPETGAGLLSLLSGATVVCVRRRRLQAAPAEARLRS
jgi:hypothetical protein